LPKDDPRACQYGSVQFSAAFLINSRCEPLHVLPTGGPLPGISSRCVRRFAWPVNCVCTGMSDDPVDQCVRGCLYQQHQDTGQFPGLAEHLSCVSGCVSGNAARAASFAARLTDVINQCARSEGCVVGRGGGGLPGEHEGGCPPQGRCCAFGCPWF
jgi:hypothetical protein